MPSASFYWLGVASGTAYPWGANTLCLAGSAFASTITAGTFQDSMHLGSGDASGEVCTGYHLRNTKFALTTGSNKVILDGATVTIGTGTPAIADLPIHIDFGYDSAVETQNVYFYTFDGTTITDEAVGVEVQAFWKDHLALGATAFLEINDDSGDVGGNNSGERLTLQAYAAATTNHHWYLGLSGSPETAGAKGSWDLGISLEYF